MVSSGYWQPHGRSRIANARHTGLVLQWKNKFGWIEPDRPIDHAEASKNNWRIYVNVSDVDESSQLYAGARVSFIAYSDGRGLGAEEVWLEEDADSGKAGPAGKGWVEKSRKGSSGWLRLQMPGKGRVQRTIEKHSQLGKGHSHGFVGTCRAKGSSAKAPSSKGSNSRSREGGTEPGKDRAGGEGGAGGAGGAVVLRPGPGLGPDRNKTTMSENGALVLSWASSEMRGWRPAMEDAAIALLQLGPPAREQLVVVLVSLVLLAVLTDIASSVQTCMLRQHLARSLGLEYSTATEVALAASMWYRQHMRSMPAKKSKGPIRHRWSWALSQHIDALAAARECPRPDGIVAAAGALSSRGAELRLDQGSLSQLMKVLLVLSSLDSHQFQRQYPGLPGSLSGPELWFSPFLEVYMRTVAQRLFNSLFPYLTLYNASTYPYSEEEAQKGIGECWETVRSTLKVASIGVRYIITAEEEGGDPGRMAEMRELLAVNNGEPASVIQEITLELSKVDTLDRASRSLSASYAVEEAQRREWKRLIPSAREEILACKRTGQFPILIEAQRVSRLSVREGFQLGQVRENVTSSPWGGERATKRSESSVARLGNFAFSATMAQRPVSFSITSSMSEPPAVQWQRLTAASAGSTDPHPRGRKRHRSSDISRPTNKALPTLPRRGSTGWSNTASGELSPRQAPPASPQEDSLVPHKLDPIPSYRRTSLATPWYIQNNVRQVEVYHQEVIDAMTQPTDELKAELTGTYTVDVSTSTHDLSKNATADVATGVDNLDRPIPEEDVLFWYPRLTITETERLLRVRDGADHGHPRGSASVIFRQSNIFIDLARERARDLLSRNKRKYKWAAPQDTTISQKPIDGAEVRPVRTSTFGNSIRTIMTCRVHRLHDRGTVLPRVARTLLVSFHLSNKVSPNRWWEDRQRRADLSSPTTGPHTKVLEDGLIQSGPGAPGARGGEPIFGAMSYHDALANNVEYAPPEINLLQYTHIPNLNFKQLCRVHSVTTVANAEYLVKLWNGNEARPPSNYSVNNKPEAYALVAWLLEEDVDPEIFWRMLKEQAAAPMQPERALVNLWQEAKIARLRVLRERIIAYHPRGRMPSVNGHFGPHAVLSCPQIGSKPRTGYGGVTISRGFGDLELVIPSCHTVEALIKEVGKETSWLWGIGSAFNLIHMYENRTLTYVCPRARVVLERMRLFPKLPGVSELFYHPKEYLCRIHFFDKLCSLLKEQVYAENTEAAGGDLHRGMGDRITIAIAETLAEERSQEIGVSFNSRLASLVTRRYGTHFMDVTGNLREAAAVSWATWDVRASAFLYGLTDQIACAMDDPVWDSDRSHQERGEEGQWESMNVLSISRTSSDTAGDDAQGPQQGRQPPPEANDRIGTLLQPEDMQVDEGGPINRPRAGEDVESYASGISLRMTLEFALPGTRRFRDLPDWVRHINNSALGIGQTEAYCLPHPTEFFIKINLARIEGRFGDVKGCHLRYLFQRMKSPPIELEKTNALRNMVLSMYGPMQAEIEAFDLIMGKTFPVFDYDLSRCLAEWRRNGALAGTLTAVVLDARRRTNMGRVFQHPTKGGKGAPLPGKGEGELKRQRDRDQLAGKGNRSIKGFVTAQSAVAESSQQISFRRRRDGAPRLATAGCCDTLPSLFVARLRNRRGAMV
ncbi:unnamed protein product [Polarella glacialis]|uniref:Uncharacterized protein n=1 Tax=Polarella glacialis TaxID=89957 RepID=A0A813KHW1_POLGL|nr:unnamed protein product [Polarella glacialis]